jgi:inhibitor of cysteine peptidase
MAIVMFGARDDGTTSHLAIGTTFGIALDENPTTGYKWSTPTYASSVLHLLSDDLEPYRGGAIGSGGVRRFVFRAISAGRSPIALSYARPWEVGAAAAARFDLTVVVTDREG